MSNKSRTSSLTIKPRNRVAINPLMKKGHAHVKSKKAERSKSKQKLRKGDYENE